jgi:methyl-accepting chemotaxis protein
LIAVTLLIIGILTAFEIEQRPIMTASAVSRETAQLIAGPRQEMAITIKNIQINVVQVQQWLTNISATRGLDGLNDGFDIAKEHSEPFYANATKAEYLSRTLALDAVGGAIKAVHAEFPLFFSTGKQMAESYIEGGSAAGNGMMADFDTAAARLGAALGAPLEMSAQSLDAARGRANERYAWSDAAISTMEKLLLGLSLAALAVVGALSMALIRTMVRPLGAATELTRRLADGETDLPISVNSRMAENTEPAHGLKVFQDTAELHLAATGALEYNATAVLALNQDGEAMVSNRAFQPLRTDCAAGWTICAPAATGCMTIPSCSRP